MKKSIIRSLVCSLLALAAAVTAPRTLHAQAASTAGKSADLWVFGGYNYTAPDYGPDDQHNTGFTYGVDYTRYLRYPIAPSLELRGANTSGKTVDEDVYLIGLRVHGTVLHRIRPYANFLAGVGKIKFAVSPYPGYTHDSGLVYSPGGGVEIDMYRNFSLKGDLQYQHWRQDANFTLTPAMVTIGITYRIPFRSYNHYGDPHN